MQASTQHALWAAALGGLSAVSLPLGSWIGLRVRPARRLLSVMGAFGAGALLAALSVELVAPTVAALGEEGGHADPRASFYALLVGAVVGGLLYFLLDQVVSAHGGFLRRTATAITYFRRLQRAKREQLADELASTPLLRAVPREHVEAMIPMLRPVVFEDGERIIEVGKNVDRLVIISEGVVVFGDDETELGRGDFVGLGSITMETPAPLAGTAKGRVVGLTLTAEQVGQLRRLSPEFDAACVERTRESLELLAQLAEFRSRRASDWLRGASAALREGSEIPNQDQLRQAKEEHSGAALAIWLGMTLDGIPESFVIGSTLFVALAAMGEAAAEVGFWQVVPYTLIAGLFLSNFPEALASSANMRMQGWQPRRIFSLWLSLMLITAVGAAGGFVFAEALSHTIVVFAEGVAAGAMLTMIAAAMIPEAVLLGGPNTVGLSTLAGFLSAISFKLLE